MPMERKYTIGEDMRFFNEKKVELLAPAGNLEIFKSIVESKCDAIYIGGHDFNMRMIRKGFNFSDEDLIEARALATQYKKKLYITVNSLIDETEVQGLEKYLNFLNEAVCPDGIIFQDMAILHLSKTLNLNFELHASVMMNVHNLDMIHILEDEGVTRVVLSREMSLEEVHNINTKSKMELEYFTHGDMCISHGSQCYYSSLLFGMSGNRGQCLKPCRWWFDTDKDKRTFPLAVKDLALYRHLPEMIAAGVTSFKIEGRMREKEFITNLINLYGESLDSYIDNPNHFNPNMDYDQIENTKKRELSTGYAFGKPGLTNINTLHEGTGKFYSTGKMFSTPTAEKDIDIIDEAKISQTLDLYKLDRGINTEISVKVQNFEQAVVAIKLGVKRLYIAGDIYLPNHPFNIKELKQLKHLMHENQELFMTTPRMMNEDQMKNFAGEIESLREFIDGVLITQMGGLAIPKYLNQALENQRTQPLRILGDFSLNLFNSKALDWYKEQGLLSGTASIELNAKQLGEFSLHSQGLELIIYGQLSSMYFEHDFNEDKEHINDQYTMSNEAGTYKIYMDQFSKTHLLTTHQLNLIPLLEDLSNMSFEMFRIEAQLMSKEELEEVIMATKNKQDYRGQLHTFGALRF